MKAIITPILLFLITLGSCKKPDDNPGNTYQMVCPARPTHLGFQSYGPGAYLASAFTPNGDGLNERLRLLSLDSSTFTSFSMKVIDKTGKTLQTVTQWYVGWDGIDPATNKTYPTGEYRVEISATLNGRGMYADSTLSESTCVWLFGPHPTIPGCSEAPDDMSIVSELRFEDQFDPATGMTVYTTGDHLCP